MKLAIQIRNSTIPQVWLIAYWNLQFRLQTPQFHNSTDVINCMLKFNEMLIFAYFLFLNLSNKRFCNLSPKCTNYTNLRDIPDIPFIILKKKKMLNSKQNVRFSLFTLIKFLIFKISFLRINTCLYEMKHINIIGLKWKKSMLYVLI